MNCEDYQKMISRWLDGELEEAEIDSLDSHLSVCPRCREVKSELSMVNELHLSLVDQPVPEGILSGLELETEQKVHTGPFSFLRTAAVAAALAAVILAGAAVGGFLAEKGISENEDEIGEILNVEYLGADPPGSTGEVLMELVQGGIEDEEK
ncbi:MAG: zf-HC2 domain-containing protein [Candidatus Krumholzibacteriales bacterium]